MGGEVKSMRILLTVACAAVAVAACGGTPDRPVGDYKLYVATSDQRQIAVIDSRSHTIDRRLPLGTPTSDWGHLYSVSGRTLNDTDPLTGLIVRSLKLPGDDYSLPSVTLSGMPGGLSQNGRWLVLNAVNVQSANALLSATRFLVVNTSFSSAPQRVDLNGYYQFDAVSNGGDYLYLIEYLTRTDYRVRMYEVNAGQLNPQVIVDKSEPQASMTGLRLSGIPSKDGAWLFSIYVREKTHPFIHALNLQGAPAALCIDLPGPGYQSDGHAMMWTMAMSSDGSYLYAANGSLGVVSEVNSAATSRPGLARTVHVDTGQSSASLFVNDVQAKMMGSNAAVVSLDGKTLVTAGKSGIVWIDTNGMRTTRRALTDWMVWSLALSPDGQNLYALNDSGKIAELSMASGQANATFDPGARYPMALMRVAAS
ncbi:MAG: hypothetical protein NVS9B11_14750 [Candidatus Dormibacteraceae bacterium]